MCCVEYFCKEKHSLSQPGCSSGLDQVKCLMRFLPFLVTSFSKIVKWFLGFPGSSAGKESTCNAGDQILSLCWEDPLEEGMATHSSIRAWRIPVDRGTWGATVHGVTRSWTRLSN